MSTVPTGLQDWIYKLEEGEWVRHLKLALVFLALAALTFWYDLREFKNFSTPEAMDTAQLARNLSEGRGYTTRFIRPLSITLLQQQRSGGAVILKEEHPDLANPPAYPLLLAGLMKVLPFRYEIRSGTLFWRHQPELLIALFNQALFFAVIYMVFQLAKRLFDAPIAWLSAAVVAGTNLLWRFSVSGLSTLLLIALLLGIVWCLVKMEQSAREERHGNTWMIVMAIVTGAMVGAGGLTRYSFAWLILPVMAFFALYFGQRRAMLCLSTLAAFLVVMGPWLMRNYDVGGTLFGTAGFAIYQETNPYPGNRLERSMPASFEQELKNPGLNQYVRKFLVQMSEIVENDLPKLGGSWVSAFFLVGLLVPFRSPALARLRVFVLLCLLVLVIVQALGRTHLSEDSPEVNSENLLVLLAPLVFMFGVGMYFVFLDQLALPLPQWRALVNGLFVFVACAPLAFALLPPRSVPFSYPPYFPPLIQETSKWMKENELMMSDMPWAVAWYGNRRCVWVTLDAGATPRKSDFFAINDFQKPIQGLYLTQLTMNAQFLSQMLKGQEWAWGRFVLESLLRTNVPAGFPLKQAPSGFLPDQLFLSDRVRWKSQPK